MGEVENPAFTVIKLAQEEHEPSDGEADVAGGDDDLHGEVRLGAAAEFVAEFFGRGEMLDHIEDENHLHIVEGAGEGIRVEIGDVEFLERAGVVGKELVHADDATAELVERAAEVARAAAEIHDGGAGGHCGDGGGVRADEAGFREVVLVVVGDGLDIEVAAVDETVVLEEGDGGGVDDVHGVADAIDAADFVAVVGRYRNFVDACAGAEKLDDDLGVEVKHVRVEFEGNAAEGGGGVGLVAGVELGERGAEDEILVGGEGFITDPLIEGHAALAGVAGGQHARAQHDVGGAVGERRKEIGQHLGGVLSVAVEEGDVVEALFDGVVVAEFLVAAVALVHGVREDGEFVAVGAEAAEFVREGVGGVAGAVVDDEDLGFVAGQGGDAAEHLHDRRLGVVGDDEDEGARRAVGGHGRLNPKKISTVFLNV